MWQVRGRATDRGRDRLDVLFPNEPRAASASRIRSRSIAVATPSNDGSWAAMPLRADSRFRVRRTVRQVQVTSVSAQVRPSRVRSKRSSCANKRTSASCVQSSARARSPSRRRSAYRAETLHRALNNGSSAPRSPSAAALIHASSCARSATGEWLLLAVRAQGTVRTAGCVVRAAVIGGRGDVIRDGRAGNSQRDDQGDVAKCFHAPYRHGPRDP